MRKETPLHILMDCDPVNKDLHREAVGAFLDVGADMNAENVRKQSPMHLAVLSVLKDWDFTCVLENVKLLIKRGGISAIDEKSCNPVMLKNTRLTG